MTRTAENARRQAKIPPSPVRVKQFPPTIEEAVAAAQGLAEDDIDGQIEIAAGLMGVSEDDVREAVLAAAQVQKQVEQGARVVVRDRAGSERAVVVQRTGRPRQPMSQPAQATVERVRASVRPQVIVERTRPSSGRLSLPGRVRVFDLTQSR